MSKEKREYGAAKLKLCRDIADNPDASPALKMARLGELWNFARNYLPLDAERAVFELSTYRLAYSILHSPYGHLLPSPLHECLNDRRLFFGGGLFVYASIVPADFHAACNVIASALHNGTASKDDIGDKLADIGARQAATADAVDALRAQTTAEHREHDTKLEGVDAKVTAIRKEAREQLPGYVTAGMAARALCRTFASAKLDPEATATKLRQRLRKAKLKDVITLDNRGTKAYRITDVLDIVKAHCAASRKPGGMDPGDATRFLAELTDIPGRVRNPEET